MRRTGEGMIQLKSGHILFHTGNDNKKINDVRFLVHKNVTRLMTKYVDVSERIAYEYITLKLAEHKFLIIRGSRRIL